MTMNQTSDNNEKNPEIIIIGQHTEVDNQTQSDNPIFVPPLLFICSHSAVCQEKRDFI